MRGATGAPGMCPSFCSESCVFGARGILERARVNERGVLTLDSLKEAVMQGNRTAQSIERGRTAVKDLTAEQANQLYVYLIFKNSICDVTLLTDSDDGEDGPPQCKLKKSHSHAMQCMSKPEVCLF